VSRERRPMPRTIEAGVLYFALVFGAGFLLGALRTVGLVPRVGARAAELIELPVMLAICLAAARFVTQRLAVPAAFGARLAVGLIALALLLVCEFTLVLPLRGLTLEQYLATRDPVSGTAYYLSLGVLALLPLWVSRR